MVENINNLGEKIELVENIIRSIEEVDYDEEGSDNEDCEVVDARQRLKEAAKIELEYIKELQSLYRVAHRFDNNNLGSCSESKDDSSDLESPPNSYDEDDCGYLLPPPQKVKKPRLSAKANKLQLGSSESKSSFFLGQQFEDAVEFRKAVTTYCVSIGRDVDYKKNDKSRIGAACKAKDKGCPWYIWASLEREKGAFTGKTHIPNHNCGKLSRVRKISCSRIATNYHSKFKVNPYLKCQEIVDMVWSEWGIKISLWLALKARKKAQNLILGEYKEQYLLLHRYAQEILRSNPHNTVKFKLDNNVFQSIYICFDAIKKGSWLVAMLVAVGRDGNNQMYPIAWACDEVENTETWTWFLQLLADDLETTDGQGYTIMSDQQKGLLRAVANTWPA